MGFIDPGAGGQSNVHCPKKRRRLETNHRLEVSEFSSRAPSLQDGRLVHVTRGSEERVAHGKDRPERRLSNYSDSTGSSVSAILTDRNWEMDTVPMPPIRALYRTVRILKGNKAIDWTPKTAGNPVNYLSRRYPNCLPKHSTTITGPLNSPMANDLSWVPDQYPKEYNVPTLQLEFLEFTINAEKMTIALPPRKVEAIQKEAARLLEMESVQIETLAQFIGTLVATKPAVPLGPLHFRALQHVKSQALNH